MGKVLHRLYLTEAVPLVKFVYLVFMLLYTAGDVCGGGGECVGV